MTKFVHAGTSIGHVEGILQALAHVVGVEHRVLSRLADALLSQGKDIGEGLNDHGEVAVEVLHPADGLLRLGELIAAFSLDHYGAGQEGTQQLLEAHRARTGTAAAVGGGEGLVQIEVNDVKAHVAGTDHAHHRIEVRSIIITQTAGFVNNLCDIQNIFIKDTNGVGVGEHQSGGVRPHRCPQGLHIHAAVRAGGDVDDLKAGHHRRGGVGAVGGVGDDDLVAAQLTTAAVVGP